MSSNGVAAFNPVPELQTCLSFNVSWVLAEPGLTIPGDLQLIQNPGTAEALQGYLDVQDSFLTNSFFWNPINVPPGEYEFNFLTYGVSGFPSGQFTIVNGTDTSCVVPFNEAVITSPTATGTLAPSASASSEVSIPVAASPDNGISGGAIAGIVIGAIAAVLGLIITLFTCKRRWSRRASGFTDHPRPFLLRFGNYFIMIGQTAGLPSFSNDSSLRLSSRQNVEAGHISTVTSGKTATAPAVPVIGSNISAMDVKKTMAESDRKLEDPEQGYTNFNPFDDKNSVQKF